MVAEAFWMDGTAQGELCVSREVQDSCDPEQARRLSHSAFENLRQNGG